MRNKRTSQGRDSVRLKIASDSTQRWLDIGFVMDFAVMSLS